MELRLQAVHGHRKVLITVLPAVEDHFGRRVRTGMFAALLVFEPKLLQLVLVVASVVVAVATATAVAVAVAVHWRQ